MSHITSTVTLPTQHSEAKTWPELRAFVQDALADAMHHPAALRGAQPQFELLISRRHLPPRLLWPEKRLRAALQAFSETLGRQGVRNDIFQVVIGNPEPARHELRVWLK